MKQKELVRQLRMAGPYNWVRYAVDPLLIDAANEIERLQKKLDKAA